MLVSQINPRLIIYIYIDRFRIETYGDLTVGSVASAMSRLIRCLDSLGFLDIRHDM